jgi:hypothetical protein
MEAPSQSAQAEAKQLNIKLEHEDGEWLAILPPHPDLPGDTELGFPASSEQEALDEARAFRSIEQSSVYKFEYDEKRDVYVVTFNDQKHESKLLAKAYQEAQKAYAEFINKPEPPKAEEPTPEPVKQRRRAVTGNGSQPAPTPMPPPNPNITSGIGNKPGQLPPAQNVGMGNKPGQNPWETLNDRLDRFEHVLFAAFEATAKALEEMKKK